MLSQELKNKFYSFAESKGHVYLKHCPLVPNDHGSVLYTNSGMYPIMKYIAEAKHPLSDSLYNIQNVVRTGAIDKVGEDAFETYFEVFGLWSFGKYDKNEAFKYVLEFLTDENYLNIDKNMLAFTCYLGDDFMSKDNESEAMLTNLGVAAKNIYFSKNNKKGPYGEEGIYGSNVRIYYDTGKAPCCDKCNPYCSCNKFVEIWDIVSFLYKKNDSGYFQLLPNKVIDMGAGFDRILALINNKDSVFDTDLYKDILSTIENVTGLNYYDNKSKFRIIADHVRTSTFILADKAKVVPSNKRQGYLLRKLIRRACTQLKTMNINEICLPIIAQSVVELYKKDYPELIENENFIYEELQKEEQRFDRIWASANVHIKKLLNKSMVVSGEDAFYLFSSLGIPIELTIEIAQQYDHIVDIEEFNVLYENHKLINKINRSLV